MVRTYVKIGNISSPISCHEKLKGTNALGFRRNAASELAKSFALQRAKIKVRSSRPSTTQAHQSVVNRACRSIDALFVIGKRYITMMLIWLHTRMMNYRELLKTSIKPRSLCCKVISRNGIRNSHQCAVTAVTMTHPRALVSIQKLQAKQSPIFSLEGCSRQT